MCQHDPTCLPCDVRGLPTPILPAFWDDGGPEDDFWPEAPTQVFDVMATSDPLWETPQSQGKFELAKLGLVLPPVGSEVNPHLSAKEIKCIARAVYTANFSQSRGVGIKPIFVSSDPEEDPRVEDLREALHKDYDGSVMCAELPPPVRTCLKGGPMGMHTSP